MNRISFTKRQSLATDLTPNSTGQSPTKNRAMLQPVDPDFNNMEDDVKNLGGEVAGTALLAEAFEESRLELFRIILLLDLEFGLNLPPIQVVSRSIKKSIFCPGDEINVGLDQLLNLIESQDNRAVVVSVFVRCIQISLSRSLCRFGSLSIQVAASQMGLEISPDGQFEIIERGPFSRFLQKHKFDFPEICVG